MCYFLRGDEELGTSVVVGGRIYREGHGLWMSRHLLVRGRAVVAWLLKEEHRPDGFDQEAEKSKTCCSQPNRRQKPLGDERSLVRRQLLFEKVVWPRMSRYRMVLATASMEIVQRFRDQSARRK